MVRFIFFCMAVLALSVAAIPLTSVIDGIAKQRAETIATADTTTAPPAEPDYFADINASPSADELNAIDTAAGGDSSAAPEAPMQGGFSGTAPAALSDSEPAADAVAPVQSQDN